MKKPVKLPLMLILMLSSCIFLIALDIMEKIQYKQQILPLLRTKICSPLPLIEHKFKKNQMWGG